MVDGNVNGGREIAKENRGKRVGAGRMKSNVLSTLDVNYSISGRVEVD